MSVSRLFPLNYFLKYVFNFTFAFSRIFLIKTTVFGKKKSWSQSCRFHDYFHVMYEFSLWWWMKCCLTMLCILHFSDEVTVDPVPSWRQAFLIERGKMTSDRYEKIRASIPTRFENLYFSHLRLKKIKKITKKKNFFFNFFSCEFS